LGSGWLGLPLAERFVARGYRVKASTRSENRLHALSAAQAEPFILDLGELPGNVQDFLRSKVLIINIPSKDIDGFKRLIKEIEHCEIESVLFVSSTSVYENTNTTITESDGAESTHHPLLIIENLFRESNKFETTILRFGGLIGYIRHPGRFFRGNKIVSDPDSGVNLIHRDDCINIIEKIVANETWDEVFNGCADSHPTKREFYTQAARLLGAPAPVFAESDEKSFKLISNEKLKRVLDYSFVYPDLMAIRYTEDE
jgi:nucleoside-diphosphate-sugar epimerase